MKIRILLCLVFSFYAINLATGQKENKKIQISGIVVDRYHNPVPDAIITVDGTKSSKSPDKNGVYKIKVKATAKKIGIYTLPPSVIEEQINGRTKIDFTLNDSIVKQIIRQSNAYGDELVNIGYGTEKRKNLTTSVGKVDAKKERYASYNSIYDLLRGEVPGVQVTGTSVRIREAASMMSDNEPLYVVDGVPVNSIDAIQPQLVSTIEVLKGPAASIYGSRGANGVIIITLRRAEKAK